MNDESVTVERKDEADLPLVPRLRFPEFRETEGWDADALGDVADFVNEKTPLEQVALENYVSTENLLSDYGGVMRASKLPTTGSVTRFKPNDTLVSNIRPYLKKVWVADKEGGASNDVIVIRAKQRLLPEYFSCLLRNDAFIDYVMTGAKGVKMPRGDIASMRTYLTLYPSKPEQQKIAYCLSSLDDLITLEAQKLDSLKTHKKGLMQQLFPREGETQPRLRFPEFQNAGEWNIKKLEEIAPLQRGFDLPSNNIRPGSVPIIYSNGPKGFHERGMAKGPGLVTGRSGTIGKLHFIESGEYWPHNTSLWVTSFKGNTPKFVYYLYESIGFLRFASGSGVPTLNRNDAHSFEVSVPCEHEEQQCIASCLTSLDDLITDQTQKLEALKTHKKGLMQQLFPQAPEPE